MDVQKRKRNNSILTKKSGTNKSNLKNNNNNKLKNNIKKIKEIKKVNFEIDNKSIESESDKLLDYKFLEEKSKVNKNFKNVTLKENFNNHLKKIYKKKRSITPSKFEKTYQKLMNKKKIKEEKVKNKILRNSIIESIDYSFNPKTNKNYNKKIIKDKIYLNYNEYTKKKNYKLEKIKEEINNDKENYLKENCTFTPKIKNNNKKRYLNDLINWNNEKKLKLIEVVKNSKKLDEEIYTFKPKILKAKNLNKNSKI